MTLSGSRSPITILLAEDEQAVRRLVVNILIGAGYHVLAAKDGAEAADIAASHQGEIALLVSDVKMPRIGGLELARNLSTKRPGIGVILMSANASDVTIPDPAWRFVQKPFQPNEFVKPVREMVAR